MVDFISSFLDNRPLPRDTRGHPAHHLFNIQPIIQLRPVDAEFIQFDFLPLLLGRVS